MASRPSAPYLSSLDVITHETTTLLHLLEEERDSISDEDRREAKRRVLKIRTEAQELFDWISAAWGEEKN